MDAGILRGLHRRLTRFLDRFADCFPRKDTRAHLPTYVRGQLSDLPEKSVEPIALKAGTPPRTLQEFLSQHHWDHDRMRDRVQEIVRDEHSGRLTIGLLDETSFVKKGDKTPGVQRQYCGAVGKQENCVVTVHLGFACDRFHCLLDGELFLPEGWSDDRDRCREAGIPDAVVYRPKSDIGLELYDRATANGVRLSWLTFDEWYGSKPEFLRGLTARGQKYVGEVPKSFVGWAAAPRVVTRAYHRRGTRGRSRKVPRLAAGAAKPRTAEWMLARGPLRDQDWVRWRVRDADRGPMVWEVKHATIVVKGADGLPGETLRLVAARNVLEPDVVKYFVTNAPAAGLGEVLFVAFSRWRVERCFEDQKGEIGLDQYEGRRYVGWKRHLALSQVSQLFLSQLRDEVGGEKGGPDGVSVAPDPGGSDPVLVAGPGPADGSAGPGRGRAGVDAEAERGGPTVARPADPPPAAGGRRPAHRDAAL